MSRRKNPPPPPARTLSEEEKQKLAGTLKPPKAALTAAQVELQREGRCIECGALLPKPEKPKKSKDVPEEIPAKRSNKCEDCDARRVPNGTGQRVDHLAQYLNSPTAEFKRLMHFFQGSSGAEQSNRRDDE